MNEVEKNMAVSALAQLLDQQPTAYAEVLAACRAMGWNASPTAQPADIIDELPSNVLPFIRRMLALLIYGDGSADSPAVVPATDRLYAQMLARQASPNYPAAGFPSDPSDPFLPMSPTRRDFAHLPQALSALSARKITNGNVTNGNATNGGAENDGIADGVSLAHILCSTEAQAAVTEICDDNTGWTMNKELPIVAGLKRLTLRCKTMSMPNYSTIFLRNPSELEELELPDLENFFFVTGNYGKNLGLINNNAKLKKVRLPNWKRVCTSSGERGAQVDVFQNCTALEEIEAPNLHFIGCEYFVVGCTSLKRVQVGTLTAQWGNAYGSYENNFQQSTANLIDFELGAGTAISLNMSWWKPTLDSSNLDQFLQNFRDHLIKRLALMTSSTTKTLTLSAGVYRAVYGLDSSDNVDQTSAAQTLSLADLGVTSEDLNEIEIAAGITTSTKYASWLSTYRAAIYWNIAK